jgi:hypothetical protein
VQKVMLNLIGDEFGNVKRSDSTFSLVSDCLGVAHGS